MNRKALQEKRNDLEAKMRSIIDTAKVEKRALNTDEVKEFDDCEREIKQIDETIKRKDVEERMEKKEMKNEMTVEQRETKAFAGYIRSVVSGIENRDATQLTKSDNGAVIPSTIVNKIIEKVENISPVYKFATKYNVGGTVNVPKEDNSAGSITVAYATEFTELTSSSNKFTTIELTGYLYGALTKVSKSLLRNSDFDLTNWVINKMAKRIASFLENELLNGTSGKTLGVAGSYDAENMKVTLASADKMNADELIDIQELVPDVFQKDCIWVMHPTTRKAIRKLKDGQGNYLLEKDSTSKWGYRLMNHDVYVSDNVAPFGTAGAEVIFYGDFSGLAVKESEKPEIQVLTETFATQHAIGIVAWGEVDAKVEDTQKIAVAVTSA